MKGYIKGRGGVLIGSDLYLGFRCVCGINILTKNLYTIKNYTHKNQLNCLHNNDNNVNNINKVIKVNN